MERIDYLLSYLNELKQINNADTHDRIVKVFEEIEKELAIK